MCVILNVNSCSPEQHTDIVADRCRLVGICHVTLFLSATPVSHTCSQYLTKKRPGTNDTTEAFTWVSLCPERPTLMPGVNALIVSQTQI